MTLHQVLCAAADRYVQRPHTVGECAWTVHDGTIYLADYADGWHRRCDPSPVGGGHIGSFSVAETADGQIEMVWCDDTDGTCDPVIVDRTVDAVLAQLNDIQTRDKE